MPRYRLCLHPRGKGRSCSMIEFRNVSKVYNNGTEALHNINLKVEKGLVVIAENDANVVMSARNLADIDTALANMINTYDIMKAKTLVLTKDAVAKIEEVFA